MLSKAERETLLTFIYRHGHGGLSAADEAALRDFVRADYPEYAKTLDREGLVRLASGVLGAHWFMKALEAVEARSEA